MTRQEVLKLVDKLNFHFAMKATVRFAGKGARAHLIEQQIDYGTGETQWFPWGSRVIIHEFAHLLDWHRRTFDRRRPHGPNFFQSLLDVLEAARVDVKEYPWEREYNCVYMEAFRRGFTNRGWRETPEREAHAALRRESRLGLRFHGKCDACGKDSFRMARFTDRLRACKCQDHLAWGQKKLIRWTDTKTLEVAHVWEGRPAVRKAKLIYG